MSESTIPASGPSDTILDIGGLLVGQAEDQKALTGVSVVIAKAGAVAGADLRGGGSGTRELNLLDPMTATDLVHAVVLSGGSAFGLDAAGGVMAWLEERGIGFDTGSAIVPLVPQAILYDLWLGDSKVRPDQAMAKRACDNATADGHGLLQGNYGAGCGASVGKIRMGVGAMKSGIGSASVQLANGFTVGALVAVNALGDVYEDGRIIAGMLGPDGQGFGDSSRVMLRMASCAINAGRNTTIGIIATNGKFSKPQCCRIAAMGHNGMARAVRPLHTTMDGDILFALATGELAASLDVAGEMAAMAVERAIVKAVKAAAPAGGLPSWQSLNRSNC